MTYLLPLPVPPSLADVHGIDPRHEYQHSHEGVGFTRDGRGYVLSEVYYYYGRYHKDDTRSYRAYIVTVLSPSFSIERQVVLEDVLSKLDRAPNAKGEEDVLFNNRITFAASADELVFANQRNVMFVFDGSLQQRAVYDPLRGGPTGLSFAAGLPGGGYLCLRGSHEVAIARPGARLSTALPELTPIATLLEPEGSLAKQTGFTAYRGFFHKLAVLDDDRFVASYFVSAGRSGLIDHDSFRYVVFDAAGKVVATLPLGAADTPYKPTAAPHWNVVASAKLAGFVTRSEHALHCFDRDGQRTARLALQDDKLEGLPELHLFGAAPTGELLLVQHKHRVLVVTQPITRPEDVAPAFEEIAAVYKSEHARLKKAVPTVSGRFLSFEAETPRAAAAAPKKVTKKKPAGEPAAAPAPVVAPIAKAMPADPEQAMAEHPDDLDARAVYGDWLAQQGDPVGDYIVAACRLASVGEADPGRAELAQRVDALLLASKEAWQRRFNTPEPLFNDRTTRVGGLPEAVRLQSVPKDPKGLDVQLARLPLRSIAFYTGAADLQRATSLRSLKRVQALEIHGDSKTKLGKNVVDWLVGLHLDQLHSLHLYRVSLGVAEASKLLSTLPRLESLQLYRCDITPEVLQAIGASAAASKLTSLSLTTNPVGSAGLQQLSRFPALRSLDLADTDVGDDVAQLDSVEPLAVTSLDLSENQRLMARGLAWVARTFPKLTELVVPKSLDPAGVDALMPLAAHLVRLGASGTELPARQRLVSQLLPRAKGLRILDFDIGPTEGLIEPILALDCIEALDLDHTTPADLLAIAQSPSARHLRHLDVDDLDDETATRFARSEHLRGLRTMRVSSRALGHAGIRALLTLPALRKLTVLYAKLKEADLAPANRIPELELVLRSCEVTPAAKRSLLAAWQHHLEM